MNVVEKYGTDVRDGGEGANRVKTTGQPLIASRVFPGS